MKANERLHARATFARMARDTKPYAIKVLGKIIPVLPGVFSPRYFSDVEWFAKKIPKIVDDRSFLEIGTGTGVISLFVAINGSKNIIATDINRSAVKNARKTFRAHGLSIPVRAGNVFAPIRAGGKFDVIFWNHPFHFSDTKPKTILESGGYDYRYKSVRTFFAGAKNHLTDGGEVLLGTSKNARLDLIRSFARQYGYKCKLIKKANIASAHRRQIKLDVRIYSFRPR